MGLRPDELMVQRADSLHPSRLLLERDGLETGAPGEPPPSVLAEVDTTNPGSSSQVYVRWQLATDQLVEGAFGALNSTRVYNIQLVGIGPQGAYIRTYFQDLYVNARVTGGTATVGTDFHMSSAAQAIDEYEYLTIRIPHGATSAQLVVWARDAGGVEAAESIEITLDPTGEPSYSLPTTGAWVGPNAALAGPAVLTIAIIDAAVPATPEWSFAGGTSLSFPETAGAVQIAIALDGPATDNVIIQFEVTGGTAVAGTNYVAFASDVDSQVVIPLGATTGILPLTLLFDPAAGSPTLDITGTVISGNCTDPAGDTLTLTITNVVVGARTVQWASATLAYPEPDDPAEELTYIVPCTTTQAFSSQTDVPFALVENNTAAGVGYTLSGGQGVPPLRVRFAPNATVGFLRFRPIANGIVGDATVTLTLQDGGSLYGLGTNDELIITITENSGGVEEPTYLAGPRGLRTGRTVVEATCAVNPPSATLPQFYNFATNEQCQVVGMARNAAGLWDAVRVLAVTANDVAGGTLGGTQVSYPGDSIGSPIRIALGSGATPAESGGYPAQDFSGLVFSIIPCGTSGTEFKRALTDSMAGASTAIPPQWVGPADALFPQTGPDLVRVEYYRVVLREDGDVTGDATPPTAGTRCMSVELWLKRRVDVDVIEGEGVLTNTNWDKDGGIVHSGGVSIPRVDGPVNLLQFEMQNVPAGWAVTWGTANPMESFAAGTATLIDADGGGAARYFAPCATMPFRFAIYNTSTSSAAEAQRVLRYRHTTVSTGHYGVTRNNVWGVMGDPLIDPVRARYRAVWSGSSYEGWRAQEETGQVFVATSRTGWNTGAGGWPNLDDRYGWFQSALPTVTDTAGGAGINGLTATVPSVGYWEHTWFALAASIMRQRVGHKDVVSGDEAWQQVLVDEYTDAGGPAGLAPWVQGGNQRLGMHRLPQFNTSALTSAIVWPSLSPGFHIMGASNSTFLKAPTSRPWNTDDGTPDPDLAVVSHEYPDGYQQYDHAHAARYREQITDGWWGCWSPLAWWQAMHLGAWVSRTMSVHIVDPDWRAGTGFGAQIFTMYESHMGWLIDRANAAGSPTEKGRCYVGDNGFTSYWWPGANLRGWGHAATLIALAYAIGGDRQRAFVVPASGPNWFESWATYHTRYTTPAGLWSNQGGANVDSHFETVWGPTNLPARIGALPPAVPPSGGTSSSPVPPFTRYHDCIMFHHNFIVAGAWAVYWRGLKNQSTALSLALRKVFRSPYYVREAARSHTAQQGILTLPYFAVPARGEYGSSSPTFPTVPDIATFIADYWHDFSTGLGQGPFNGSIGNQAAGFQQTKFAMCIYAWRDARDSEDPEADLYLTPALSYFFVPNELAPDFEEVVELAYPPLRRLTNANETGNAAALALHGEHTFYAPFVYEMLNRVT